MSTSRPPGRYVTFAWLSLLGYILSFALSFAVAEAVASGLGSRYDGGPEPGYPTWVIAVSAFIAMLVFAIPGLFAWWFGRRAWRAGDARGRVPAWLGLGVAFGFAVMTMGAVVLPYM